MDTKNDLPAPANPGNGGTAVFFDNGGTPTTAQRVGVTLYCDVPVTVKLQWAPDGVTALVDTGDVFTLDAGQEDTVEVPLRGGRNKFVGIPSGNPSTWRAAPYTSTSRAPGA